MSIPVIDLFAGPGGLNEGFSRVLSRCGEPVFETILSVEKDPTAHATLELRALYRRLHATQVGRSAYFSYVTGRISRSELFEKAGFAAEEAKSEAMLVELGGRASNLKVEQRIGAALRARNARDCVVIGGPPCQAYSLAGRSRRAKESREEFEADPRHKLYLEYLQIVRRFEPAVFVMENVEGLLSATWRGHPTMQLICKGLSRAGYELHSLGRPNNFRFKQYLLNASDFGVPQFRHRVFIVGVRKDINRRPAELKIGSKLSSLADVIDDLPLIRSKLSKEPDSGRAWRDAIREVSSKLEGCDEAFATNLSERAKAVSADLQLGRPAVPRVALPKSHADWYRSSEVEFVLNHNSRGHMRSDLWRYFFWAEYAAYHDRSPRLCDAPSALLPSHANASRDSKVKAFLDRFRVQLAKRPSTTVTSHIARDGHYYIHPDSSQCRSLSVREAARLQTFSDDYFFEGPVTEQYKQVGNAVPPMLAHQIGASIASILS
jgi:DNA (cytosine-5)-methyltransferase 1